MSGFGVAVGIRGVSKRYGAVTAVEDFTVEVAAGEFLALLGPSGSGKSTLLMTIAGFETPSTGEITLDGRPITRQPPHRRRIGMVFQRYALFPHLTVAENVAYPLRRRGMRGRELEKEVARALALVCLAELGPRYPAQLSGGQQQRVALARALVFDPPILLMDEPLGALDRKLRQQLQIEIKLLHRELGATILFVTHDQEEALSMADRVAVLDHGRMQQLGTPRELYDRPANPFVAGFIGETNFFPVRCAASGDGDVVADIDGSDLSVTVPAAAVTAPTNGRGLLGVRPEHIRLVASGPGLLGRVVETAFAGPDLNLLLDACGHRVLARLPVSPDQMLPRAGDEMTVGIDPGRCRLYPPGAGPAITPSPT